MTKDEYIEELKQLKVIATEQKDVPMILELLERIRRIE